VALTGSRGSRAACAVGVLLFAGACSSHSNATGGHDANDGSSSGSNDPGRPDAAATSSGSASSGSASIDGGLSGGPDGASGGNDASGVGPIGDSQGPTAARVSDFLATLGVCVHIAQGVDSAPESATAMAYAGIRNLRDDGNPAAVSNWIAVYQKAGVRTCMLPNSDLSTTIDMAKKLKAAGALLAVEGPNEPNNFPVTYEGKTSDSSSTFLPVAHFQRDLYAAIRAEPSLNGVPVFHSSEAGGSEPDNVGLQFLTIPADAGTTMPSGTKYADYANTHNYVCGHNNQLVDNVCWNASDPTLNGDWDGPYVEYGHTWHAGFNGYSDTDLVTLPKVTTETGWVTSGKGAITEEQQGRLFLNLYLSAFKRGWAYTFLYMLRDDPNQGIWGLFDTSYQPKRSGTYLHNLTTILADTSSRTPGRLDYSIASEPATVHDLLLQKSDGTFDVIVWDERPAGGTDAVTVNLGASRSVAKAFDPTMGTAPTQTLPNVGSISLTLGDHPIVLEIGL
jgi:hypothetical protein